MPPKLNDDRTKARRLQVRALVRRVYAESGCRIRRLGEVSDNSHHGIWLQLFASDTDMRPVTLDTVIAWLENPDTQEFARRLLSEILLTFDVQQVRLSDLQRYAASASHNQIALTLVKTLAERMGLIPANETNTAEVTTSVVAK